MKNEEEITALAREYGEYVANNPIYTPILKTDEQKGATIRANAHRAKDVIKWMTDKFCIADKKSVRALLQDARQGVTVAAYCGVPSDKYTEKLDLLESLFPEIAKEVQL